MYTIENHFNYIIKWSMEFFCQWKVMGFRSPCILHIAALNHEKLILVDNWTIRNYINLQNEIRLQHGHLIGIYQFFCYSRVPIYHILSVTVVQIISLYLSVHKYVDNSIFISYLKLRNLHRYYLHAYFTVNNRLNIE
jgi:hypothetical protein